MSDLLSLGASGIRAYSGALQVTGDNIANAQTPGYARRTVRLAEPVPGSDIFPYRARVAADGVNLVGVTRTTDAWLVEDARTAGGDAARASSRLGWLEATERTLDNGGAGVGRSLTALFNRADELAADPSSASRRTAFLQSTDDLATGFRRTADGLTSIAAGIAQDATLAVADLNTQVAALARVNEGLRAARSGSSNQASLLDERDRLLDAVAAALPVATSFEANGAAIVSLPGGPAILSGPDRATFSVTAGADGRLAFGLSPGSATTAITPAGGRLAGLADSASHVADQRSALDTLAATVADTLNARHRAGRDDTGAAGLDLFSSGATASAMLAVSLTTEQVAAADAVSANGNALAFGSLRGSAGSESAWATLAAQQSQAVAGARAQDSAAASRRDGATGARDALSNVDLDREASDLIRFQQAYDASARVLQVARETLRSIMDAI